MIVDERLAVGTVLIIESGMNDEIGWDSPLRVVRSFTRREAVDAFRATASSPSEDLRASDFAPFLIDAGFVRLVPERSTWFVGHDHFEP